MTAGMEWTTTAFNTSQERVNNCKLISIELFYKYVTTDEGLRGCQRNICHHFCYIIFVAGVGDIIHPLYIFLFLFFR